MARFKWTNELIILLIETYRDLECLWNAKDQKYECRNTKHDAWLEWSEIIGADNEVEVKRKIKNWVGQFFRERKKYRSYKRSGAGALFISKCFAYNYMLFLADKNKVRPCTEEGLNDNTEDFSSASEHDYEAEEPDSPMPRYTHTANSTQNNEESEDILADQTPQAGNKRSAEESTSQAIDTYPGTSAQQFSEPRPLTPQLSEPGLWAQQLSKRSKRDSTPVNKITKRKRTNYECADERQEEAYKVLKELQHKKPRRRFQIFGEHVGLKIESLKCEYAQNTVEHLISTILWKAANAKYDYRPMVHNTPYSSGSSNQFQSTSIPQLSSESSDQYELPFAQATVSSRSDNQYQYEIRVISNEQLHEDYVAPILSNTSYSFSNNSDHAAAPRVDTLQSFKKPLRMQA